MVWKNRINNGNDNNGDGLCHDVDHHRDETEESFDRMRRCIDELNNQKEESETENFELSNQLSLQIPHISKLQGTVNLLRRELKYTRFALAAALLSTAALGTILYNSESDEQKQHIEAVESEEVTKADLAHALINALESNQELRKQLTEK